MLPKTITNHQTSERGSGRAGKRFLVMSREGIGSMFREAGEDVKLRVCGCHTRRKRNQHIIRGIPIRGWLRIF